MGDYIYKSFYFFVYKTNSKRRQQESNLATPKGVIKPCFKSEALVKSGDLLIYSQRL